MTYFAKKALPFVVAHAGCYGCPTMTLKAAAGAAAAAGLGVTAKKLYALAAGKMVPGFKTVAIAAMRPRTHFCTGTKLTAMATRHASGFVLHFGPAA